VDSSLETAHPFVDRHGATAEEAFVFLIDFLFVPIGVIRLHKLDHPSAGEGSVVRCESSQVPAIEQMIKTRDNGEKAHARDR